jgi:hypothetical protein
MWHHLLFGSILVLVISSAGEAMLSMVDVSPSDTSETLVEMAKNSRQPFHRGSGRRTLLPNVYTMTA